MDLEVQDGLVARLDPVVPDHLAGLVDLSDQEVPVVQVAQAKSSEFNKHTIVHILKSETYGTFLARWFWWRSG